MGSMESMFGCLCLIYLKRWFGIYRAHNHRESDHNFILVRKEVYSIGNMQYFTTPMHILQKSILNLDSGHILMNYVPSRKKFFF